jgi:antibiotic biosynthesis monooxygenase (ABM) superfamily enzyme
MKEYLVFKELIVEHLMLAFFALVLGQVFLDGFNPISTDPWKTFIRLTALLVCLTPVMGWYVVPLFSVLLVISLASIYGAQEKG